MRVIGNPYSPLKVFHHQEKLQQLKRGQQIVPTQMQLIISDLCNQDCAEEGTLISTPSGEVAIEELAVGDTVTSSNGESEIIATKWRWTDEIYEIKIGTQLLRVTGEHPIWTDKEWKKARDITTEDTAAVCVWLRSACEVEPSSQEVGEVFVRTCTEPQQVQVCKENGTITKGTKVSHCSQMPVRLWEESRETQTRSRKLLGRLSKEPSSNWQKNTVRRNEGDALPENVGRQSHVQSGNSSESTYNKVSKQTSIQIGKQFYCLDREMQTSHYLCRKWQPVGGSTESRLSCVQAEKSIGAKFFGNYSTRSVSEENSRELWYSDGSILYEFRVANTRCVQTGPSKSTVSKIKNFTSSFRQFGSPMERNMEFQRVDSIRRIEERVKVYNIHCPPDEAYFANGILVHNCSFCAYRMSGYTASELFTEGSELAVVGTNNPKRQIPKEKVFEILDDCAEMGIKGIQFTGGGEPTVHPKFAEIYDYALGLGLIPALVTNGLLLSKYVEVVAESAWVRVSVDAGSSKSYSDIRRVPEEQYDRVWENIAQLVEHKKKHKKDNLIIGVGFVVTKENWHEVVLFTQKAKSVGVDNVRFSGVFQPDNAAYFTPFYADASKACKRAEHLGTEDFKVFNLFGDRVEDLREESPDYLYCGYQEFNTYVGGDLNVYRCCVQSYSMHGLVGSLKEQRFKELWESDEKKKDFAGFSATSCERCQFNEKNRTILYALSADPMHVDFV